MIRNGGGQPHQLVEQSDKVGTRNPFSFAPDGRRLSYYELSNETGTDIYTVAVDLTDPENPKPGRPEPFQHSQFNENAAAFSPDGRWIAYASDVSGLAQIYVQPFPGPGGKWQISNMGGRFATWSRDGKQFFFETLDDYIMVVDYTVKDHSFFPGRPRQWSTVQVRDTGSLNMTIAPDGKRFVVFPAAAQDKQEKSNLHATFLLNFTEELRRRLSTR